MDPRSDPAPDLPEIEIHKNLPALGGSDTAEPGTRQLSEPSICGAGGAGGHGAHGLAHLVGEAAGHQLAATGSGSLAQVAARPHRPPPRYLRELLELAKRHSLAAWAVRYLGTEVYGVQADATMEAKTRDLTTFVRWFVAYNQHGDVHHWLPRDSAAYLNSVDLAGRAPTTVNRHHATLRHFAKWAHEQPGQVFAVGGMPMRGIKDRITQEPDCKKLSRPQVHALLKAADAIVHLDGQPGAGGAAETGADIEAERRGRKNARPRRNRAMLALLYYAGLRVSEQVRLTIGQLQGSHLVNVQRKGRAVSRRIFLVAECRRMLDDYLATERRADIEAAAKGQGEARGAHDSAMPLFVSTVCDNRNPGGFLRRQQVNRVLGRISAQAAARSPKAAPIHVHPHRLRHTFGAQHREKSGSDAETAAALGHTGIQHVGRYARKTDDERDALLEEVFE